jgi:hypothetical protein
MHNPDKPVEGDIGEKTIEIVVGVAASPGMVSEFVGGMEAELSDRMTARVPNVRWRFQAVSDRLAVPPTDVAEIISAGRQRLLREGWDLAVVVTDLPIATSRRPVIAHASASHGIAVVSMPALGAMGVRQRLAETVTRLVAALIGDISAAEVDQHGVVNRCGPPPDVMRRVEELGHKIEVDESDVRMVARVTVGNIRLLVGMLRANRPWQLSTHLTRASITALGTAALALVTSDIWQLADALGAVRLSLITVASVLTTICTFIIGAQLWERSPHPEAREQVILFNIVTLATVTIGVLTLYGTLLVLTWLGSLILVPTELLSGTLGHPVRIGDQWKLVWLTSSLATIGEAVGAGWESNESVREAAYTYRADDQALPEETFAQAST